MKKATATNEEPTLCPLKFEELETSLTQTPTRKYQPLMPVHFEELNSLWPTDPRIPSTRSRRAWAEARGLNPVNVNSWWYRRRKVAKKLKISIPKEKYDQDVGVPPVIPSVESIKIEDIFAPTIPALINADMKDDNASSPTHIPSSDDFSSMDESYLTTITLPNSDCDETSIEETVPAVPPLSGALGSLELIPHPRKLCISPSPPTLFIPKALQLEHVEDTDDLATQLETGRNALWAERDALWASFYALDTLYPSPLLPTNIYGLPLSSCASKAFWKLSASASESGIPSELQTKLFSLEDADYVDGDGLSSLEAPWCINGFRIHFDGSMIGLCSCFRADADTLTPSHSCDLDTLEGL